MQAYRWLGRFTVSAALLASLLHVPLAAQEATGRVVGRIGEAAGGRPLRGVTIQLEPGLRAAVSDAAGRFEFRALPAGEYRVGVQMLGREDEARTVQVTAGAAVQVDFSLAPAAIALNPVTVTATRGPRAVADVPVPVSVVDRAELDARSPIKVGDMFPLEPGVEMEGGGPFLGMPVIRGLSGNRVLVLVDGQRLNNSREAINFGGVQPSLVDVDRIEEVEILRGPASVLYGTDALGGIVNLITSRGSFSSSGIESNLRLRSGMSTVDGGREISGDASVAGTSLALRGALTWREAENFESPEGEVVNSGARSLDGNLELTWAPARGQRIGLELSRFRARDVGVPGSTGVFTAVYPTTDRDKLAFDYTLDRVGPLGSLRLDAFVQDQEENFASVLDLPPISAGPFRLLIDTESERVSDVRTTGFGLQLDRSLGTSTHLTYGVDFFRDAVDEERAETTTTVREPVSPGPPPSTTVAVDSFPTTPESTFQGAGVYLQGEIERGRWLLIPGLRYDRFDVHTELLTRPEGDLAPRDQVDDALSGSLGALFRATSAVQPTFTVGRAFRSPNIIERYFFGPGSQGGLSVPNPDLRSETSVNVDVGLRLEVSRLQARATVFRNRISDFITFVSGTFNGSPTFGGRPVSQVANVGRAQIQGFEASADYLLPGGAIRWDLFASVSAAEGEDLESGAPLYVPPLKGVVGFGGSHARSGAALRTTIRMVGRQDEIPENVTAAPGFTVVDAHATFDLSSWTPARATLRFGVENLFDRAYQESRSSHLSAGRNFRTSLNLSF